MLLALFRSVGRWLGLCCVRALGQCVPIGSPGRGSGRTLYVNLSATRHSMLTPSLSPFGTAIPCGASLGTLALRRPLLNQGYRVRRVPSLSRASARKGCLASSLAASTCEIASSFADRGSPSHADRERPDKQPTPIKEHRPARARRQLPEVLGRPEKRQAINIERCLCLSF